ncbi:MAG TPA: BON domain-containing protein [Nitrospiria bacterium]|nr:BON domain-containing protein [Nitrospiria bacterium]
MRRTVWVAMMTGMLMVLGEHVGAQASLVQPAAPVSAADQALALNINNALRQDPYLDYRNVRAEARQGGAILLGIVLTDFEKARAAQVARGVPGVKVVTNRLLVVRDAAGGESDLARRVRDVLLGEDPTLHVTALDIETEESDTIVLTGIVASAGTKARIGAAAANVRGVGRVINELDVEPAT